MFDKERYSRQLALQEWSEAAQQKLAEAKVLVVGAGALGSACLPYLAAAGVGTIGVADGDQLEISNLHRQVLFREEDLGLNKARVLVERLQGLNSEVKWKSFEAFLRRDNIANIATDFDCIIDGTDNFATRYLVNDYCVFNEKWNVHGSIQGFSGQLAVFNAITQMGRSANYRDLYPIPPAPESVKNCAEHGVIGALPGMIGAQMALETIKHIADLPDKLWNRLVIVNTAPWGMQSFNIAQDPDNPLRTGELTELIDYDLFCGTKNQKIMKSISVKELNEWMQKGEDFQLIDCREPAEFEEVNMNGHLIPLQQIPTRQDEIARDKKVVIHCKMGGRSANAVQYLNQQGFDNLYNLEGGIMAWLNNK